MPAVAGFVTVPSAAQFIRQFQLRIGRRRRWPRPVVARSLIAGVTDDDRLAGARNRQLAQAGSFQLKNCVAADDKSGNIL